MSIDWITVAAQIGNFLVLIWLLKRFLYQPILAGIDAREAEITQRMREAETAKTDAQAAEAQYRELAATLKAEQSEAAKLLIRQAEDQRDALLAEARSRLETERKTWQAHLEQERQKYVVKLHRASAAALLSLTRKALLDLAAETLEPKMAQHLVEQIKAMTPDLQRAAEASNEAVISSHDKLPKTVREDLADALKEIVPQMTIRFEEDQEQVKGITLRMGGTQLAWTVDTYLDDLDAALEERLMAEV